MTEFQRMSIKFGEELHMRIERDLYLNRLISKMHNGKVKIITGIRRCGKSYLLRHIFRDYLLKSGVKADHILEIALDQKQYEAFRNPDTLYDYVINSMTADGEYYLFVDEIQLSYKVKREDTDLSRIANEDRALAYTTFYDVLNDLMAKPNLDIYVTGSNSRMLSKDIATNFRDRGSEIRMFPLSFSEFYSISEMEKADAWAEYIVYGGMPLAVLEKDENEKAAYLSGLFDRVYIADVVERYGVDDSYVENLIDVVASSVGSLTNPSKLANTLNSVNHAHTSDKTVKKYLDALEDAFIFEKALRPSSPSSPSKSRNVLIGFFLGAMLAVAVITVRFVMDDKIHSSEDVEKYIGIPTLGVLPMQQNRFSSQQKKRQKRGASA